MLTEDDVELLVEKMSDALQNGDVGNNRPTSRKEKLLIKLVWIAIGIIWLLIQAYVGLRIQNINDGINENKKSILNIQSNIQNISGTIIQLETQLNGKSDFKLIKQMELER